MTSQFDTYDYDDNNEWRNGDDEEGGATSLLGEEGCLFPGECCMPGPHYESECHTPDMMENGLGVEPRSPWRYACRHQCKPAHSASAAAPSAGSASGASCAATVPNVSKPA